MQTRIESNTTAARHGIGRVVGFALFGCLVVVLPVAGDPLQSGWLWTGCGALVCVVAELLGSVGAIGRCVRSDMVPCAVAVGVGVTLDFLRVPPQALLDLCTSSRPAWGLDAIRDHCRWFPATMLAMLIAIALPRLRRSPIANVGYAGKAIAELSGMASDLVIMAIAMTVCMTAMRHFSIVGHVPWVAGGVICAMLVGMLAFTLSRALLQSIARQCLQAFLREKRAI